MRPYGIETEYGIMVLGEEEIDVVAESIELVRSYMERGTLMKWDYQLEDPHVDARGFRVRELLQDTDEANYFQIDHDRPLSFQEIKSDLVLANGARFYNDHAHPEYSTPECSNLNEIVAQDRAGECILHECALRRSAMLGRSVRLYKNNTDFDGHSYGCHDNYLVSREVKWERLVSGMLPFLVTRQIFAGAGKLGIEAEGKLLQSGVYQIAQRSDFFSVLTSVDTMNRRPLVNTRDEAHADPKKWRRFHVIIGDANMSEFATALKIGTTSMALKLIELGLAPDIELAQPIEATKAISRDPSHSWIVELRDGRKISAIDIQRAYLEAARVHLEPEEDHAWIFREWENVLNDLEVDPLRCVDRLDWVAKWHLLDTFRQSEDLAWSDPWLQSLDLEYHNIDPENGLYHALSREGTIRRFVSDEAVAAAIKNPPSSTRAFFRGQVVSRFAGQIASLQWDAVALLTTTGKFTIPFPEVADSPRLDALNKIIVAVKNTDELRDRIRSLDGA
ncbi:MAG: proteasome accessory factor PafA2 family protein [Chthoniobacterales bacterium]